MSASTITSDFSDSLIWVVTRFIFIVVNLLVMLTLFFELVAILADFYEPFISGEHAYYSTWWFSSKELLIIHGLLLFFWYFAGVIIWVIAIFAANSWIPPLLHFLGTAYLMVFGIPQSWGLAATRFFSLLGQ